MQALFLNVLNMSITAGYVVLAVLLIRLMIKKAPKKYAYLLWTVVLFRLVCPVSFSWALSVFSAKPFDMTAAQSGGNAALVYVPADVAYMESPKVTVGIPAMNGAINGSLPVATPAASVNPLQIWMLLGTILWCTGMAVLLIYSIAAFIGLKRRMRTAVRLENNVFESDRIRSPFVLGLIAPRIYIPFGLGERERAYILRHEAYHLERRDHLIKLLGFLVLVAHWFNPLVWLAFALMTRDMEMSCDEKVLSQTGASIAKDYGTSLLSFAANRRFPAANPLAFGETSIRERVKNVLRFREPKRWAALTALVLCAIAVAACAANPRTKAVPTDAQGLYGSYAFEKQVYMSSISSFMPPDGYEEYYTLSESALVITDQRGLQRIVPIAFEFETVDEDAFRNDFMADVGIPDISMYEERYQYTLNAASDYDLPS